MVIASIGIALVLAGQPAAAKPSPEVAREMTEAIGAANKALGLESWEAHGIKPCVDRGGEGANAKDVSPEDTRTCAETAVGKQFPALGKSFVLAILMAPIGPATVLPFRIPHPHRSAAYSSHPRPKRLPTQHNP